MFITLGKAFSIRAISGIISLVVVFFFLVLARGLPVISLGSKVV